MWLIFSIFNHFMWSLVCMMKTHNSTSDNHRARGVTRINISVSHDPSLGSRPFKCSASFAHKHDFILLLPSFSTKLLTFLLYCYIPTHIKNNTAYEIFCLILALSPFPKRILKSQSHTDYALKMNIYERVGMCMYVLKLDGECKLCA